jgi:glutathione synthase/RimK-type ligase-like ATP-grasp enzyme
MRKLIILTDEKHFPFDIDDVHLPTALQAKGISIECQLWHDYRPRPLDSVLVRTIWDYTQNFAHFRTLLREMKKQKCNVINPVDVLFWNADKSYLLDLLQKKLPVIPTEIYNSFEPIAVQMNHYPLIVKPAVGSAGIGAFMIPSSADWILAQSLLGQRVLVQPFLETVKTEGEISFIFFGGELSHSVIKRPKIGEFRVHEEHGGESRPYNPKATEIQTARSILNACQWNCDYARVDMIVQNGRLLLVELELIEPSFYFRYFNDEPEMRLAEAIAKRLVSFQVKE